MSIIAARISALFLALCLLAGPGLAQTAQLPASGPDTAKTNTVAAPAGQAPRKAKPQPDAISEKTAALLRRSKRTYDALKKEFEKQAAAIAAPDTSNSNLATVRGQLEKLRRGALEARGILTKPLAEQKAQLAELGPAPKDGKSEADSIAKSRKRLQTEVNRLEGMAKKLDLLALEADQLDGQAAAIQRDRFIKQVFVATTSIINPRLWIDAGRELPQFFARISSVFSSWATAPSEPGKISGYVSMLAYAGLCVLALLGLLVVWAKMSRPPRRLGPPDDLRRIWRAVGGIGLAAAVTGIAYVLSLVVIDLSAVSDLRIMRLVLVFGSAIAESALMLTVMRAVIAPSNSDWRLINMDDDSARAFFRGGFLAVAVYGVNSIAAGAAEVTFMPFDFTVGAHAVAGLALAMLMAYMLVTARNSSWLILPEEAQDSRRFYFSWAGRLFLVVWLVIILAIGAELLGYIALAHFVLTKMLLSGAVVSALYLVHHLVDALVTSGTRPYSQFGKFLRKKMALGEVTIARLGILLSTVTDLAITLIGIPVVLALWAITWVDFGSLLDKFVFGFTIGDVTINLSSILIAIVVLIAGIIVARLFTMWMDNRVLARTGLDSGIRNSISTGAKYTAFALAALFALSVAGLDFSKLAIVAGALSVGIGFGLQSVVSNFVSGLILLAERPIRIGDWIVVSGKEGTVSKINVRSTEILTFDRCSVIIPNSNLISEVVENWSHGSPVGRIKVNVGVSYDADPEQVREILLACA
ncbi:MAG TPA: mechanosensitive ion channel family protein, partial [Rhizobiales bacterium]|nr:mechanosensitive ion channel family protein [Hyphomicrobiales bacterium]